MVSETPILLLVFNRPDTTKAVFEVLKLVKPKKLYIAADGSRDGNSIDEKLTSEVKQIFNAIDWKCDLKTLYRESNLGCKNSIRGALDWFFEHEEYGIVLEDDCVPDLTFFDFCTQMLQIYQNDTSVKLISGSSLWFGKYNHSDNYFFSHYVNVWGWASWRRTWHEVDFSFFENNKNWDKIESKFDSVISNKIVKNYLKNICLNTFYFKTISTWDIYLTASIIFKDGKTIVPFKNLIKNIGFIGTHADGNISSSQNLPLVPIEVNNSKLEKAVGFEKSYLTNIAKVISNGKGWWHRLKFQKKIELEYKIAVQKVNSFNID